MRRYIEYDRSPLYKSLLRDIGEFCEHASGTRLRRYQREVASTIIKSVLRKKGLSLVVMFPRQSGKNELQAQIETYLLTILMHMNGTEMVKVSPTWKPQSLNAMRRLERVLAQQFMVNNLWEKESGYIYRVGQARLSFLSGEPEANIVGATASTLLEVDEAQDVSIQKFDKEIAPMAASTNATQVFWGTAWTGRTLLARELAVARELERQDGIKRAFVLTANEVGKEVKAYKIFVARQIARLGRNHPMVKTQFFSEAIDAEGSLFSPARQALMQGAHAWQAQPLAGRLYAFTLDVAGADETQTTLELSGSSGHDATALTVFDIDLSTLQDEFRKAPTYRVVNRYSWTGVAQANLYGQITSLAEVWQARYVVVDATGIGAGLASFLDRALPGRVLPFVFTAKSKSGLGWKFITLIEAGRYKEPAMGDQPLQQQFWRQVHYCQATVLDGPGRTIRWGVPDGTRDALTGALVHDDLVISAALCGALDCQRWSLAESVVVEAEDPLALDRRYR